MFRNNLKNLANLRPSPGMFNSKMLSPSYRMALMRSARIIPKRSYAEKGKMFRFVPKRNFNQKFDRIVEDLISRLPNGNIGIALVGINTLFYLLYLIWPPDIIHKFLNNFTISNYNLSKGRLHTLLFAHFTHMGFLSYLLDSLILFLF